MTRVKLPYYVIRKGRGYFEIGKARSKATGLPASEPLGKDGPEAWAAAERAYRDFKAALSGTPDRTGGYPVGSLGAAWTMWKASEEYKDKEPRTQEDYERGWKHIEPRFGRRLIAKITVSDSEAFHREMQKVLKENEAHRTLKIWRALLNMLAKKHLLPRAPVGTVPNKQPKGRGQFWLASEVEQLAADALKLTFAPEAFHLKPGSPSPSYEFMNLLIRLAWESMMSPVDCRTFELSMLKQDAGGYYIDRVRTKTRAAAKPPISLELARDLISYSERLPATPLGGTTGLLRTPVEYREISKNYLGDAFAKVRDVSFKGDKRQFLDIRRSANLEAELGGASAEDRAMVMANALDKNKALDATYTPSTVARARKLVESREIGRELLAQTGQNREQSRKPRLGGV